MVCHARILSASIFLVCATTVVTWGGVASDSGRIRVDAPTRRFVDELGRTRIFHGVNVVRKKFPWHPEVGGTFDPLVSLNDADMVDLARWGLNVVRLGVMWPGVEPEDGLFNQT